VEITLAIGDQVLPGKLPLMPQRYQMIAAAHELSEEARASRGKRGRHTGGAEYELGLVLVAFVGACWAGDPLDCPSLRQHRYDVVAYGEGVMDSLIRMGFDPATVMRAGRAVHEQVVASMPTEEEIEEAADPTGAPAGAST
jgi:hypothetical protein